MWWSEKFLRTLHQVFLLLPRSGRDKSLFDASSSSSCDLRKGVLPSPDPRPLSPWPALDDHDGDDGDGEEEEEEEGMTARYSLQ